MTQVKSWYKLRKSNYKIIKRFVRSGYSGWELNGSLREGRIDSTPKKQIY